MWFDLGLNAIARIVASSAWEPERRLIGTRTLRTNHLRTLLALLRLKQRAEEDWIHAGNWRKETAPQQLLASLITQYAETVPGAWTPGEPLDDNQIHEAASSELARIEEVDLEERRSAAQELVKLPKFAQFWGRPPVIEGKTESRRA